MVLGVWKFIPFTVYVFVLAYIREVDDVSLEYVMMVAIGFDVVDVFIRSAYLFACIDTRHRKFVTCAYTLILVAIDISGMVSVLDSRIRTINTLLAMRFYHATVFLCYEVLSDIRQSPNKDIEV